MVVDLLREQEIVSQQGPDHAGHCWIEEHLIHKAFAVRKVGLVPVVAVQLLKYPIVSRLWNHAFSAQEIPFLQNSSTSWSFSVGLMPATVRSITSKLIYSNSSHTEPQIAQLSVDPQGGGARNRIRGQTSHTT